MTQFHGQILTVFKSVLQKSKHSIKVHGVLHKTTLKQLCGIIQRANMSNYKEYVAMF